jgi:Cu-Zn family superoxide dismutase
MKTSGILFTAMIFGLIAFTILFFSRDSPDMEGVAVFQTSDVQGEVVFQQRRNGVVLDVLFTRLPPGAHGFHIHKSGDLRGKGCLAACDHWHKGSHSKHGGPPGEEGHRHTGDLGNVEIPQGQKELRAEYFLEGVKVDEIIGRSLIVHEDPDDLGKGGHPDSLTTGHSGARIACAVIGRTASCGKKTKAATRKAKN